MSWYCPGIVALWIAIFYGVLQGSTELFPVSSLGHAVVVPPLLHIPVHESSKSFVPFLVLLHIGTATALIAVYWRQWGRIVGGFFHSAVTGQIGHGDDRLAWLLIVGTIPTGIVGFLFQKPLQNLFADPRLASGLLIANGGILLGAELLRRRSERRAGISHRDPGLEAGRYRTVEDLGFVQAAMVGVCQTLALFPGISRSGSTMAGGLVAGLRHEEAVRFSFLLATPIILAAGLLELPSLAGVAGLGSIIVGAVVAGLTAYASGRFLIRFFRVGRLDPYAYYCAGLGLIGLILLT